jgi:hypothetical protein
LVREYKDYELAYCESQSVADAKHLEANLLEQYEMEHGELSPQNKRR